MDWQPILSGVGIGISRPCAVTGTAAPATGGVGAADERALRCGPHHSPAGGLAPRSGGNVHVTGQSLTRWRPLPPSSSTGRMREVVPGLIEPVSALDALLHKPGHGRRRFDGVGVTVVGILLVTVVVRDMFRTLFHPVGHGSIAPHAVRTARRKRWAATPLPLMASPRGHAHRMSPTPVVESSRSRRECAKSRSALLTSSI